MTQNGAFLASRKASVTAWWKFRFANVGNRIVGADTPFDLADPKHIGQQGEIEAHGGRGKAFPSAWVYLR
jgi:hypothetical protein